MMENSSITSYKLRAFHQSFDESESKCNTYERILHVELLNYEQSIFYSLDRDELKTTWNKSR